MSEQIRVFQASLKPQGAKVGQNKSKDGVVRPTLSAGVATGSKRTPAKKRRPRPNATLAKQNVAQPPLEAQVEATPPVVDPGTDTPQLGLRPFSMMDESAIITMTQEEMGPVYRTTYGYDLDMSSVMEYVQTAHTRVVTVGDQVAGYVSLTVDESGRMNIGSLVLTKPYQGKGYGTRIMRQVEQEARAMGISELEVYIQSANERSISFAKSLGYTEVQSNVQHTVIMRKTLQPLQPVQRQPVQ